MVTLNWLEHYWLCLNLSIFNLDESRSNESLNDWLSEIENDSFVHLTDIPSNKLKWEIVVQQFYISQSTAKQMFNEVRKSQIDSSSVQVKHWEKSR